MRAFRHPLPAQLALYHLYLSGNGFRVSGVERALMLSSWDVEWTNREICWEIQLKSSPSQSLTYNYNFVFFF